MKNKIAEDKQTAWGVRLALIEAQLFIAQRDLNRAVRRFHESFDEEALARKFAIVGGLELAKKHAQTLYERFTDFNNQQGQAA